MTYLQHPHNSTYHKALRIQQHTARSFVTISPPDYLAVWLMDQGYKPLAKSNNAAEYARFGRNRVGECLAELVILYWDGSAVVSGINWQSAAYLLKSICEVAPASVCLFDPLDQESGVLG